MRLPAGRGTSIVRWVHRCLLWIFATGVCLVLATSAEYSVASAVFTQGPPEPALHRTYGDYVHISSTKPPTASGHGWWNFEPGFGPGDVAGPPIAFMSESSGAFVVADVTVQLQINLSGKWVNAGPPGKKRVPPGGGSVARANARFLCVTTAEHQWRSIVDADLVGHDDTPEKLITPARTLPCGI